MFFDEVMRSMPNKKRSVKVVLAIALLPLLFLLMSLQVFAQSSSLRVTVRDAKQAVLPGAEVTAINVGTNVEAKGTTDNSGVYNFASLQPGTYKVVASAAGFTTKTMTDVRIRVGTPSDLPIELAPAGSNIEINVTATAESMILDAGASTGTVIQEDMLPQLPTMTNDVLDLINVMGGVVKADNPLWGGTDATFAGVSANNINISRDGITVNEIRYNSGIASPSRMNTEMVGEFKMVLSPVDAEMGRGAGQIQMTTRSGSNAFHGSGVWNVQNTSLDAKEWITKTYNQPLAPDWRNLNNYTLTLSGPIIKDKTFFFLTWDHQIARSRNELRSNVLTKCARKGIYRYLENRGPGNATAGGSINTRQVYDPVTEKTTTLVGVTRPNVGYNGEILDNYDSAHTYNWPSGIWLPDYSAQVTAGPENQNTTNSFLQDSTRLVYNSVIGVLSPADRMLLGGQNSQFARYGNDSEASPISHYDLPIYNDCEGYSIPANGIVGAHAWDSFQTHYDSSGFVAAFSQLMPLPNDYQVGDGLNTAGYRWTRTVKGQDTVFGTVYDANRKAITGKIDYNINSSHRASGTYSYESDKSSDAGVLQTWPNGFYGGINRAPQTFTGSLTSTFRPTLLNEFRMGLSRTRTRTDDPLSNPATKDGVSKLLKQLASDAGWVYPDYILAGPGNFFPGGANTHFYGGAITSTWGGVDPRWTFNDTLTWMKGAHSFKGGFEFRMNKSWQEADGDGQFSAVNTFPSVRGGVTSSAYRPSKDLGTPQMGPLSGLYGDVWEGFNEYEKQDRGMGGLNSKYSGAYDLMAYVSGSVGQITQYYNIDPRTKGWTNPLDTPKHITDLRNREFSFFFKDDWKLNSSVTLNLGVRYEYYGVPWIESGLAAGIEGNIAGMFGVSRNNPAWMADINTLTNQVKEGYDLTANGTRQIYIGKNSEHPDILPFNKDTNNFAPHVGFAWQLPWFGKGKTTLRGGYSISYSAIGNFDSTFGYSGNLAHQPGQNFSYNYNGSKGCNKPVSGDDYCYMSFDTLNNVLSTPLTPPPDQAIFGTLYTIDSGVQGGSLTIYDPNIKNPYIQNVNMSLTRQIGNVLTLDVRYIGTLQRKSSSSWNVNTTNYINNGLFNELQRLRAGTGDLSSFDPDNGFPMLNRYIPSQLIGDTTASLYAPRLSNGTIVENLTGAEQVLYSQWSSLSTGDFQSVASAIARANFASNLTGEGGKRIAPGPGETSQVLRYNRMNRRNVALDRGAWGEANDLWAPANLVNANPQYSGVNINRNQGRSNYHSMQVQATMRPMRGLSFQASYTWSRSLSRGSVLNWADPEWVMDYGLSGQQRTHAVTTYGTYTLPLGANGFIFRNSKGALKKAVEGWQVSWIGQVSSGSPMGITGSSSLWGNNKMVQVGDFNTKSGRIKWDPTYQNGGALYYGDNYAIVGDKQCYSAAVTTMTNRFSGGSQTMRSSCVGSMLTLARKDDNGPVLDPWNSGGFFSQPTKGYTIFQNALPGEIGNTPTNNLTGPGRWSLDMNLAKSVEFMEGKRIELRIDAQNVLNHAAPSFDFGRFSGAASTTQGARFTAAANPNTSLAWGAFGIPFGQVNAKAGHRTFQAKIRLSF